MQEFMQNHPLATMIVCCLPLTVVIVQLCKFAVWAWDSLSAFSFRKRESGLVGTVRPAFNPAREFLRAKLLAGGYDKHHAYHITDGGFVLVADALDYYFALFAGIEEFWNIVASAISEKRSNHLLTAPLEQIEFGDGKGTYSRIYDASGETYVDVLFPNDLPYPYFCSWVSAEMFKDAIVKRQAEAKNANCRGDADVFHAANSTTTA